MYKSISYIVLFSQILIGCGTTHKLSRIGYEQSSTEIKDCKVVLTKDISENTTAIKKGELNLGDSGSSTQCAPEDAFAILKNEACHLNANLVVISDEKMPDFISSCYRCHATFYTLDSSVLNQKYNLNNTISSDLIGQLNSEAKGSNAVVNVLGGALGFVGGYYLARLLFKK
jgi:hypothetical protein